MDPSPSTSFVVPFIVCGGGDRRRIFSQTPFVGFELHLFSSCFKPSHLGVLMFAQKRPETTIKYEIIGGRQRIKKEWKKNIRRVTKLNLPVWRDFELNLNPLSYSNIFFSLKLLLIHFGLFSISFFIEHCLDGFLIQFSHLLNFLGIVQST